MFQVRSGLFSFGVLFQSLRQLLQLLAHALARIQLIAHLRRRHARLKLSADPHSQLSACNPSRSIAVTLNPARMAGSIERLDSQSRHTQRGWEAMRGRAAR